MPPRPDSDSDTAPDARSRSVDGAPTSDGAVMVAADTIGGCRSVHGTYPECPLCSGRLFPEHAHFKCSGCGWRDSCCD